MRLSGISRAVQDAYARADDRGISNADLYGHVARDVGIDAEEFARRVPVGKLGALHSPKQRSARFCQQTCKGLGLIEHVPGKRGYWRPTTEGKIRLRRIERGSVVLVCSTRLGVALWGDIRDVARLITTPISLYLSSPPYPLRKPRSYGNCDQTEYVDFMLHALEPIVKRLRPGGSLVLNLGTDLFEPQSPARSLYRERLVLALHDQLGLKLMDNLVWVNPCKPPGPVQWASKSRVHLHAGWEAVLWMTNDPARVTASNQRVLQPHSDRHLKLVAGGGEKRTQSYSDGSHAIRVGSFSKPTAGKIPRNVLVYGSTCADQRAYKRAARAAGLAAHGAPMPLRLAEFLVRFLSAPGELVVDGMAGSLTTAVAAERNDRRWVACDVIGDYLKGALSRFSAKAGLWVNPDFDRAFCEDGAL